MPASGDSFGGRTLLGEYDYYALFQELNTTVGAWFEISAVKSGSSQ